MLISLIRIVRDYMRRRATLQQLAELDDRTLRDIGLARVTVKGWTATE